MRIASSRPLLVAAATAAAAITVSPSIAFAEPARTLCYAGTQHAKVSGIEKTVKVVLERTLDPAASQVRQRSWSEQDPSHTVEQMAKIDAKAGTFEFDDPQLGAHGTGTLEGKPWHWSGMKMTVTKGTLVIKSATQVSDARIHQQADMTNDKQPIGTVTGDLTAFDCRNLDAQRAALGTSGSSGTGGTSGSSGSTGSAAPAPAPAKPSK